MRLRSLSFAAAILPLAAACSSGDDSGVAGDAAADVKHDVATTPYAPGYGTDPSRDAAASRAGDSAAPPLDAGRPDGASTPPTSPAPPAPTPTAPTPPAPPTSTTPTPPTPPDAAAPLDASLPDVGAALGGGCPNDPKYAVEFTQALNPKPCVQGCAANECCYANAACVAR